MYTDQDSQTTHLLLLIKVCYSCLTYSPFYHAFQAIALFNADQYDEANLLIKELTTGCPNADTLACCVVQVGIFHAWSLILIFATSYLRHIYAFNSELKP
jgi:hypothetical protein